MCLSMELEDTPFILFQLWDVEGNNKFWMFPTFQKKLEQHSLKRRGGKEFENGGFLG